jgi:type II secretory pathway pseudopilin PulG
MRALSLVASAGRHASGALIEATLVLGIVGALIAGTMLVAGARPPAATGVKAADSAVWVVELSGARAASALGRGDHFTVGYSTRSRQPWAEAKCFPNATTEYSGTYSDGSIYGETFSVYAGGPTPQDFVLGVSLRKYWTGGGADCRVDLITVDSKGLRRSLLARTRFDAAS